MSGERVISDLREKSRKEGYSKWSEIRQVPEVILCGMGKNCPKRPNAVFK